MSERRYFTYIVASRSRTLYTGVTNNIEKRIREHRDGTLEGFSKEYACQRLVWFEIFGYIDDAITREKQLKRWVRRKKIDLIERANPTWIDLSAEWGKPMQMYQWLDEQRQQAGPSTSLRFAQDDRVEVIEDDRVEVVERVNQEDIATIRQKSTED